MKVEIFTDGACRGNPGPGGWGVVLRYDGHEKHLFGAEANTTNNRMELSAAINGLAALNRSCVVELTTDSKYLHDGITVWLPHWKLKQWRNSTNKPVKNKDLWERLDQEVQRHRITWHWIKGHSGHAENELADLLANKAIDNLFSNSR